MHLGQRLFAKLRKPAVKTHFYPFLAADAGASWLSEPVQHVGRDLQLFPSSGSGIVLTSLGICVASCPALPCLVALIIPTARGPEGNRGVESAGGAFWDFFWGEFHVKTQKRKGGKRLPCAGFPIRERSA